MTARVALRRRSGLPRFTRLELLNWRNFRSVDISLGERAFILGPNAAGKSNLLDALRFISELAQSGSGGLQAAVERRGGFSSLRSLFARNPPHIRLAVTVGDDALPDRWRYELQLNRLGKENFPLSSTNPSISMMVAAPWRSIVAQRAATPGNRRRRCLSRSAKVKGSEICRSSWRLAAICMWCRKSFVIARVRDWMVKSLLAATCCGV